MKKFVAHPGLLNSSYIVFVHMFILLLAPVFAGYFPESVRGFSLAFNIIYPLAIFWLFFLIKQYEDAIISLRFILGFFSLSALFSFISAVKGPLAGGDLPVIRILFFGPYLFAGSYASLLYASMFLFYGLVTYVSALIAASLAELVYVRILHKILPKPLKSILVKVDSHADTASTKLSDQYFYMNQNIGVIVSAAILGCLFVAYLSLIIFN